MLVETISTEDLGDRSYVVHDGDRAVVVDPQRDIDRVEAVLDAHGLTLALVCETHVHNDYVTGGLGLARRHDVPYLVNAADPVDFAREPVRDGDEVALAGLTVRAVATPGHTPTHLSYVVDDGSGPPAVFSGGSLLYGAVGRTDLVEPDRAEAHARAQYRSARRLADALPDAAALYPTHGFGSFCSAGGSSGAARGTIGDERVTNDALREPDERAFAARMVDGLTAFPAYYAHMAPANLAGPDPVDLSPLSDLGPDELGKRVAAGEWVVDLRERDTHAREHLAGSIGIALAPPFSTWLGWLIPWGTPVALIGEDEDQVAEAQRRLGRIGIDRPVGRAVGPIARVAGDQPTRGHPTATFDDLGRAGDPTVLDVRRADEFRAGHVVGALNLPLPELERRAGELPAVRLWVHCQSGYRASIAASLLARAGHDVVLVAEDFSRAADLGLTTAS